MYMDMISTIPYSGDNRVMAITAMSTRRRLALQDGHCGAGGAGVVCCGGGSLRGMGRKAWVVGGDAGGVGGVDVGVNAGDGNTEGEAEEEEVNMDEEDGQDG